MSEELRWARRDIGRERLQDYAIGRNESDDGYDNALYDALSAIQRRIAALEAQAGTRRGT